MNSEDNAFIQKAKTENPAEVVEGKVRKAWQESGLIEEVPEEHVDLFNLDPYAGLKESAPEVNGEVTDATKVDIETVKKEAAERGMANSIVITEENAELVHVLLTATKRGRNGVNVLRFSARVIPSLLNTNLDQDAVMKFINMKNPDGSYRFGATEIASFSGKDLDQNTVMKFINMKNSDGSYRFDYDDIHRLANKYYLDQNTIMKLADMKNPDGSYRFNYYEIIDLANKNHDQDKVMKYADMKNPDGSFIFNHDVISILADKNLDKDAAVRLDVLFSDTYMNELKQNSAGKYQKEVMELLNPANMTSEQLKSILASGLSKSEYFEAVKKLSKSTFKLAYDKPNQYLSGIALKYSTPVNGKLPQLPETELAREREKITEFFKRNTGLVLKTLKYIDTDTVSHMMDKRTDLFLKSLTDLNELSDDNLALLSKLITCKSETTGKKLSPKEKIQLCQIMEILQEVNIETSELKNCADKGSIDINVPKQMIVNKILKNAGLEPNDPKIMKDKTKFNEEFSFLLLKNQTDDAITRLQENRSMYYSKFDELRNNPAKREEQINLVKTGLKRYGAMISPDLRKYMEDFIEIIRNIDNYTNEQIFDKMLESARAAIKETRETNELFTVIQKAVTSDFKEFITDESNIYGQTNKKTKQIFEETGLNYDKWLNPDIEDVTVETGGKSMSIRMWARNPQEDLFMGNKTTCCTAIGTGGNAAATPSYLLNTSYNVVELYDASGNVVGMSRVFMGKTDGKPTLIMDNIELNKTYIKGMNDEQLTKIRNGFFDYMNQYAEQVTGDKNAQVRFYSQDIHVPHADLASESKVTDFVGAFTSSSNRGENYVYVNSAGCSWIEPVKLNACGAIEWLVVPKNAAEINN